MEMIRNNRIYSSMIEVIEYDEYFSIFSITSE